MAKLFVSYSRKDSAAARKIIQAFKAIEQDVWVDWEDIPPAADWLEQIFRGIEGSDAFIFIISPDSTASEVCNVEVGHAAKNNKRIIPIVVRDVDPKTGNVNPIIKKLNWTFMREQDNFDEGIGRVKTAIELDLVWVEEHSRLQLRALEWDREKDSSLLLRGKDLRTARQMVEGAKDKDPQPSPLQQTYIQNSNQDERRRLIVWTATVLAVVIMAGLSFFALYQRDRANRNAEEARKNEVIAQQQKGIAEKNEELARNNEQEARKAQQEAEDARGIAEENKKIAEAQRSAARAQIYQVRPGELYTSTLLAIASWQGIHSPEAEEILRKNISLLPVPVKQMVHAGSVNSLEFNPNGDAFVTASADDSACAWNASDGKNLFCATSPGSVNDAVFSPDGKIIVMGDDSGAVQFIDAREGTVQNTFEFGVTIWDLDIRPDGKTLAVVRDDGKISIIDLVARKKSFDLQAAGARIASFSPNSLYIAAGSNSGAITIWSLNEKNKIISIASHKAEVLAIEFSPNSKYLVSGGKDRIAFIFETITGDELLRIPNEDAVEDVTFSPDGSWFVTASDDHRIRVWDTFSAKERVRMLQDGVVTQVEVSSNGQWIATTGNDRTVRVWNVSTGAEIFQIPLKGEGSALGFSRDGRYLVSGDKSGDINILDISVMPTPKSYVQFNGLAESARFSPDGDLIAASDDNRVWLLNPKATSNLTARPQGDPSLALKGNVRDIVISPDSKWLGASSEAGNVLIYDIARNAPRVIIKSGLRYALAFTPDSRQLIGGNSAGNVQTWDLSMGRAGSTLIEKGLSVRSIAASPTLLGLGMQDRIAILDLNSGQKVFDIESTGENETLAFNSDATLLASGDSSGNVHIWKVENGAFVLLHTLNKEPAFSLAFDPQNDWIAVGASENVYLIDPVTGKEAARIPHASAVNGVSFTPDGNTLVTASFKVIQFWDMTKIQSIDSDHLVGTACSRLTANFNESQWNLHFENEAYRPLCAGLP